jgi:aspartate 1-decarboxylase
MEEAMLVEMLKSKIHRARVTEKRLDYEGSITIDSILMEGADIAERVLKPMSSKAERTLDRYA